MMKKSFFISLMALASIVLPLPANAQIDKSEIQEAINVLRGMSLDHTPEWAVERLKSVDDSTFAPLASNALAMAYLTGTGVAQDSATAVAYFEKAANLGYSKAFHNLGMLQKNASYGSQNFQKAVEYFEKGAQAGAPICNYDAGYMYYKGLGCQQDYVRAIEYFKKGAHNSPSCQYMLGLCYRNGYGVEADEEIAKAYLEKASLANYRYAIEETLREDAEVQPSISVNADLVPETMPESELFLESTDDLSGVYRGVVATYDWSGNHVVKEQNLEIQFRKADDSYYGLWIQEKDTISFSAVIEEDGLLRFCNTQMFMSDRYIEGKKAEYIFEDASLALLNNSLSGGLRLYSMTQMEPQRPMYLSLNKDGEDSENADKYVCHLSAYPVDGTNQVEVCFKMPEDVNSASIYMSTPNGMTAKSYKLGGLQKGTHRFVISTNLKKGIYAVTLFADKYHGQTLIMLK